MSALGRTGPPPMVVLDVSAVHPFAGGGHSYAHILTRHLPDAGVDPLCLTRRGSSTDEWDQRSVLPIVPRNRLHRLVWEQTSMLRALHRHAPTASVLHSIHYTMPERPNPAGLARVVTIHDLTFFTHPLGHSPAKRRLFRRAIAVAAQRADQLICVSEATARDLLRLVDVRVPVDVIPHGIDLGHFTPHEPSNGHDATIIEGLGIDRPYILHLGTIEPRKNVARFLEAAAKLRGGERLDVVLVGGAWPGEREALPRPEGLRVHHLGVVRDAAIPALLRSARAVAYPSLAEGFGLPVIEALACGAPVVTSFGSVMEELAPGAVVTTDPLSADAICVALETALTGRGPSLDTRVGAAARFDVRDCARRHVAVYNRFR